MPTVRITDVILRDAHQSLIATRMRTEDMLPACARLDRVGYWSLEVWGGATFDACLRYLKEDPWERLRRLREALPGTRLQMLLRGQNLLGYRHYPDDVVRAFVERAVANGIDVFRIFDALNDLRNLEVPVEAVKTLGKHAQGTICYTTSPVHDVPRFVEMARTLEAMGCDSIVVKDMAGLLTPTVAGELFRALHAVVRVPLHLHSHNSAGLAYMSHLKAIENGCSHIDTAVSAFADGPSHPATESIVAALQGTEYDTGLDLALLQSISAYFLEVRRKYRRFEGEYAVPDTRVQTNQVPGGMISNLYQQLREQDALSRLDEVLAEIPRVREDLGYPPLVTPTSQIVGTQALLNVLTGARYKTITNEVKLYLQGRYGKAPAPINDWVRQLAIGNAEVMEARPADALPPEMDALREAAGTLAVSDEDVMTLAMFPELGREFLEHRAAGTLVPEPLQIPGTETAEPAAVPTEFNVTLHGETYHIQVTGSGHHTRHQRPFYVYVDGMPEEILVEALDGPEEAADSVAPGRRTTVQGSRRPRPSGPGHVTAAMPGTIVEVRVQPGDTVQAGDPLLVSEAMKMETEVQAPIAGTVAAVYVVKGDKVNPDETLIEIRP